MQPWILGLTGGIGSGKSAAAEHFAHLGIDLVDADQAARWVVEPGKPALTAITQRFGQKILLDDGTLNRAALRHEIFTDQSSRQWLESLLHPLIRDEIHQALARATSPYAILVSPLLVESKQNEATQRVLVIDVPETLQIERSMRRDMASREQIEAIMKNQARRDERLAKAHDVIVNDQDLNWLHSEVERLHQFYLTLRGGQ